MNGFRRVFYSGSFLVEAVLIIQSKIGFKLCSFSLVKKLYKKLNTGLWCSLASIGRSGELFFFMKKENILKSLEMRSDKSSNLFRPTKNQRGDFYETL